jgi:hypothetical protein
MLYLFTGALVLYSAHQAFMSFYQSNWMAGQLWAANVVIWTLVTIKYWKRR